MKLSVILLSLLLVVGCEKVTPEQRAQMEQKRQEEAQRRDYQIIKLFDKDGCSVYEFNAHGDHHYFTNCNGSTSTQQGCGKNCTREEEISTQVGL